MRLIDADAAYKAACEGADNWDGAYSPYRYDRIREEMDKVPTFSPWHRVEDELPDDSRDVIIFTVSKIIGVGSFIRPNWYQWYSGGGLPVDVTHWMPLPDLPKEGAK